MGHAQSAQHSFHHQHPHHRAYHRPHGPSPGGSAGEGSSEAEDGGPRWNTHSFPRDPARIRGRPTHAPLQLAPENRVLPKLGPPPKLRTTDNGNILHNGGTISGRKISQPQLVAPVKAYRARHDPRANGGPQERGRPGSRNGGAALSNSRSRFGGSEPDLRAPRPSSRQGPPQQQPPNNARPASRMPASAAAAAAARKKYKAPPPPPVGAPQDSESPSDTTWEEGGSGVPRRARLFKTRVQTNGSPAPARPREDPGPTPRPLGPAATNFLAQRSVSSPEFQLELVRAAQRRHRERQEGKSSSPLAHKKQPAPTQPSQQRQPRISPTPAGPRHAPVGREASGESKENTRSRSPASERSSLKKTTRVPAPAPPPINATPKTFYFGMEESRGAADEDEVDRFAARLRNNPRLRARSSSPGSGVSGSGDEEPHLKTGDINLQLRPTLPKKTPDIPRFSPTAAWRQLLVEPLPPSRGEQDDDSENEESRRTPVLRGGGGTAALLEERIVQSLLQRAPLAARGSVATHEKSGDSGISGDASPGPGATLLDSPDPAPVPHPRGRRLHASPANNRQWTPEQDLDETSSEDERACSRSPPARSPHVQRRTVSEERPGETAFRGERGRQAGRITPPKFTRRSHMFSLSLPRPDQLQAARTCDELESPIESPDSPDGGTFHSLQKQRRAVSHQQLSLDENWYLSRSAPNSLDSSGGEAAVWGPRALTTQQTNHSPEPEEDESPPSSSTPGFSYLAGGGHIMYLPEYDSRRFSSPRPTQLHAGQRSRSVDVLSGFRGKDSGVLSIARSNDAPQEMKEKRPESPWGEIMKEEEQSAPPQVSQPPPTTKKSSKRFTFQSTIRQIERRRIAERLSREAESRELHRRQEAEAMRRVEEDFQRKRAREKASLKEQLRLFSLQEPMEGPQSLPAQFAEPVAPARARGCRVEPEGAVGAKTSSSVDKEPAKARAEPREYRDYTASPAKLSSRFPSGERASPPTPGSPASSGSGGAARRGMLMQHPPAVFDMPKSTQVFVAPHPSHTAPIIVGETPRNPEHHNYRREFARGAVPGGGLSPRAGHVPRARLTSSSPVQQHEQESGASRGHESVNNFSSLPPQQASSSSTNNSALPRISGLQPFGVTRAKGYRPIAFKPAAGTKATKLAQVVS